MNYDSDKMKLYDGIVDSHFHLYHMQKNGMDAFSIIEECFKHGLEYALDIGINHENFTERIKGAGKYPGLFNAHGFYPSQCTSEHLDEELSFLEKCLAEDPKALALGETGLDFYHSYGSRQLQEDLFIRQMRLADRLDLPVIIHSREAESETLEITAAEKPRRGGIIHCYSYSAETAIKFIEQGFYISFAGNVTYKKSNLLQEAAAAVPVDRLLVETDAPYLSPEGVRGRKNHPGYIGYTYDFIAGLRQCPVEELITAVNENFRRLFNFEK